MYIKPKSRPAVSFKDAVQMTEQQHKDAVRIQNILKQHSSTGIVTHFAKHPPQYADMASAPDFYEAQNILAETRSMFEEIPSKIRKQFDNDPGQFLDFIQNPDNADQMLEMGLDTDHFENVTESPTMTSSSQVHLEQDILQKTRNDALKLLEGANQEQLNAFLQSQKNSNPSGE